MKAVFLRAVILSQIIIPTIAVAQASAYEEDSWFGTREHQEQVSREIRAKERASYDSLHARVSARIEKAFGLPSGSLTINLTDNYGSYVSVYTYTSMDNRVQCAMLNVRLNQFSVNCNGKAMFTIER